jgi:hypothetical protein
MKAIITSLLFTLSIAVSCIGAPFPAVKAPKITGKIVAATWVGLFHYDEINVHPYVNIEGVGESSPKYYIILSATNLSDQLRKKISQYTKNSNFAPKLLQRELKEGEMILIMNSPRLIELKVGALLKITNYDIRGDEFRSWVKHDKLTLNGAKPTKAKQIPNYVDDFEDKE